MEDILAVILSELEQTYEQLGVLSKGQVRLRDTTENLQQEFVKGQKQLQE